MASEHSAGGAAEAAANRGARPSRLNVIESSDRARERARSAVARAAEAELRARQSLDRAAAHTVLVRQLAGALLAATAAPEVVELLEERALDPMRVQARLVAVDPKGATVQLELALGELDPLEPPPAPAARAADGPVARATLRSAERAQRYADEARARDTLEAVVRQMPVSVLLADAPSGRVTLANDHACRLLGEEARSWPGVEAYGTVRMRRPGGATFDAGDWPLARALTAGTTTVEQQVQVSSPDGMDRHLLVSAAPVMALDGSVAAAVQVMVDVTARHEAAVAREAILGVLSHELRTPVTTLLGGSELLHDRWGMLDDEEREELMAANVAEAERLRGIIDNMLVLARIDAGVEAVDRHPVLLQRAADRVVGRERRRFARTTFAVVGGPGLPAVLADEGAVEQVLTNLLSNAAKYGPARGRVTVDLRRTGDEVVVRVVDDGPGLPVDEIPDLFRLYVRGSGANRRASGAGIGLYVASRLIGAMGGRLWASNRPEGGAEFGFSLAVASTVSGVVGRAAGSAAGS